MDFVSFVWGVVTGACITVVGVVVIWIWAAWEFFRGS